MSPRSSTIEGRSTIVEDLGDIVPRSVVRKQLVAVDGQVGGVEGIAPVASSFTSGSLPSTLRVSRTHRDARDARADPQPSPTRSYTITTTSSSGSRVCGATFDANTDHTERGGESEHDEVPPLGDFAVRLHQSEVDVFAQILLREVPEWWYLVVLALAAALGMIGIGVYPTNSSPATVIFGIIPDPPLPPLPLPSCVEGCATDPGTRA
jgi:hypothetical protein